MMWHFYEIPYIPDLELVKYQSLGEQGIDVFLSDIIVFYVNGKGILF